MEDTYLKDTYLKQILICDYCKSGLDIAVRNLLLSNDDIDVCYDDGTCFYFAFENKDKEVGEMILINLLLYAAKQIGNNKLSLDKLATTIDDAISRSYEYDNNPKYKKLINMLIKDID